MAKGSRTLAQAAADGGVVVTTRAHKLESWAEVLGPVVPSKTAAELLGMTRGRLDRARRHGTVLGIRTAAGRWVYPLKQFCTTSEGKVEVLDRLSEILRALYAVGDEAGAARWLATPNHRLQGAAPWSQLQERDGGAAVVVAAQAQACAWTQR